MKTAMDQLTFGVELEVTMPHGATPVGPHGAGMQVPWLPTGWLADGDPSLPYDARRRGVEFVSPVLKGVEGLRQVVAAVREIVAHGGRVTARGGLHVHVGWANAAPGNQWKRLCNGTALHETALYAITGTKKRERGRWCRSIRPLIAAINTGDRVAIGHHLRHHGRYFTLNLQNLFDGRRETAEFRVFAGTLNPTKVVAYVHFCLTLVCRAINAPAHLPKQAKPAHELPKYRGKGPGEAAVEHWLECYGWEGDKRTTYAMEMPADLPSCKFRRPNCDGWPANTTPSNDVPRIGRARASAGPTFTCPLGDRTMRSITTLSLEDVVDEGATFEPATLAAVERLARRKPWRLGDREALEAFQTCVDALCVAYRMRPICLVRRGGTGMSDTSWHDRRGRQITLCGRRSVVTLLHLFARCRQAQATGRTDRYAAMRWSINLFRVAFPRSFARCQLVDGLLVNERRNETL